MPNRIHLTGDTPAAMVQPSFDAITLYLADRDDTVRDLLARLMVALEPLGLEVEERHTVELVLAEVLNNIVKHAYPEGQSLGQVSLSIALKNNGLHVYVQDDGEPMPGGQAPLGLPRDVETDILDLPEGGFGWFLIKDLAKDVRYWRDAEKNRLSLRLVVGLSQAV